MGSAVAPSFANIFMHHIETNLFLIQPYTQYCHDHQGKPLQYILKYYCYLDDIFVIWDGPIEIFEKMVLTANTAHKTITFTAEQSKTELNFLDVNEKIYNGISNQIPTLTPQYQDNFFEAKHHVSQLKWKVLEVVNRPPRGGDWDKLMLQREARWIVKLECTKPKALQYVDDLGHQSGNWVQYLNYVGAAKPKEKITTVWQSWFLVGVDVLFVFV
ncbi:hypothetical protein XELAEV_18011025mg [Xenopus laevis]|uniref:Reverse transcriptase domain-containing protein n=1 Tax=Xenopus laevis TaxID=8355 RepID=A0A974I2H5_XENLA|nr:hypothetical protein XELAEV_18011025mg [Xenopus laevis]